MPRMAVIVQWRNASGQRELCAVDVLKHIVDAKFKMALQPIEFASGTFPALEFETDGLIGNAFRTAAGIQREIYNTYGVHSWIYINQRNISDIVTAIEQEVLTAAKELKKTQSFFGDRRIETNKNRLKYAVDKAVGVTPLESVGLKPEEV